MIDNKIVVILSSAAVLILITVIAVMGIKISSLSENLEDNQLIYKGELDKSKLLIDEISQNLQIMSASTNEVRRSLNLPAKQLIQQKGAVPESEEQNLSVSFFEALSFLVQNEDLEKSAAEFSLYLEENGIVKYFKEYDYNFDRIDLTQAIVSKDGIQYLTLYYDGDSQIVHFRDIAGNSFELPLENEKLISSLDKELEILNSYFDSIENMKIEVKKLVLDDEVNAILHERDLSIHESGDLNYTVNLNMDDTVVGSFSLNKNILTLNSSTYDSSDDFKSALLIFLKQVSNITRSEIIDKLVLDKMESIFTDEGFKALLESNGCQRDISRREDEEFVYYDVLNSDNSVKGSFALQKEFGEVLLLTGDGKYLKSLKMFTADHDFKSLIIDNNDSDETSLYTFDDSSENFLVIGAHEHNADTMIIVNANNKTGKLNMISIPRDLYYKGSKINSIYKTYGPEKLCTELSDITGLDIKKYISIDMFAFIDVVNILGGLDVTLDEDLIDPTYKVKNNGIWSTLYYRKGTHHLDGVAALRVARSRHGSDDFNRSKRQQQVIKAIINSIKSLNAGDIDKFYDFMTTISNYINTNLSIGDIVKNYLMYKDNEIGAPNTINTDNILYATYSNLYLLSEEEQSIVMESDDFYKGLWIVLPDNNDWNLIKKYIGKTLQIGT